jgi:hypothetical protein
MDEAAEEELGLELVSEEVVWLYLVTKNTDLNNRGRRDLSKSQLKQEFLIGSPRVPPSVYNNWTVNFDRRMRILNNWTCNAGASHKRLILYYIILYYAQARLSR